MARTPKITAKEPLLKTHPHLKAFVPWLDLLTNESERGQVLISSGFLEQQPKDIFQAFLIENSGTETLFEGANAPLGSFSARIAACFALGLISDGEHHDLTLLRKIRNDFAHSVHTSFSTPSVTSRCSQLLARARGDHINSHGAFMTGATAIILSLVNRAHYVRKERRVLKAYPH
jgi:mannitol operon repressor